MRSSPWEEDSRFEVERQIVCELARNQRCDAKFRLRKANTCRIRLS
jgi:hypothetical protein